MYVCLAHMVNALARSALITRTPRDPFNPDPDITPEDFNDKFFLDADEMLLASSVAYSDESPKTKKRVMVMASAVDQSTTGKKRAKPCNNSDDNCSFDDDYSLVNGNEQHLSVVDHATMCDWLQSHKDDAGQHVDSMRKVVALINSRATHSLKQMELYENDMLTFVDDLIQMRDTLKESNIARIIRQLGMSA